MRFDCKILPLLYLLVNCTPNSAQNLDRLDGSVYKQCLIDKSGCNVQTEIKCTYPAANGTTRYCATPGKYDGDNRETFLRRVNSDRCDANSSPPEVTATIVYRICNNNDFSINLNRNGNKMMFGSVDVRPNGWNDQLPKRTCKEHTITRKMNLCDTNDTMVLRLEGSLDKNGPNYCFCWMAQTTLNAPIKSPTTSPTTFPSTSPTESPSRGVPSTCKDRQNYIFGTFVRNGKMYKRDCNWLTSNKLRLEQRRNIWCPKTINGRKVEDECRATCRNCKSPGETSDEVCANPLDVVITELAEPYDSQVGKFIELYFHNCGGKVIQTNMKLLRFPSGSADPSSNFVDLNNVKIRDDGFVTLCMFSNANLEEVYGRGTCTLTSTSSKQITVRGRDTYAVVTGGLANYNIIDIYGIPGLGGNTNPAQDFADGRAVRNINAITPSDGWDQDSWIVFPGEGEQVVGEEGTDPNEWKFVKKEIKTRLIITEIIDPSDGADMSVPRYVELYAPRTSDRGKGSKDDLKLVVFHSDDTTPDFRSAVYISYIPENGFILVCNESAFRTLGDKCNIVKDDIGGPADSNGNDQIAIISGDQRNYFVVDIFGVVGEEGFDSEHSFHDSRVVRNQDVRKPQPKWSLSDWTIQPNAGFYKADPAEWKNPNIVMNAPSASPSTPPSLRSQDCKLIITEMTNPIDNPHAGYIELHSDCPNSRVHGDLRVVKWQLGGVVELSLKGFEVKSDGFIIICRDKNTHMYAYNHMVGSYFPGRVQKNRCDIEDPDIVSNGYEPMAIVEGDVGDRQFIDNFGFPGQTLFGTEYSFRDGRAVRNHEELENYGFFNPNIWMINPPHFDHAFTVDNDPREWEAFPLELFFTELCDPADSERARFIELYSPNHRNYIIREQLIIIKYEDGSNEPENYINLTGLKINENGFLVLCSNALIFGDKCDKVLGDWSVADSDGHSQFVLAKCLYPDQSCRNLDTFGIIGENPEGTASDYKTGRAVRLRNPFVSASSVFDSSKWYAVPGENGRNSVSHYDCDPGEWNYVVIDNGEDNNNNKDKDKDKDKDKYKDKEKNKNLRN